MLEKSRRESPKAFTLIELLIVVAIIAILAAIAVPNFLEAQTRSKVSRAKADMRSVATAIEAYFVDNNRYPIASQWVTLLTPNTFNNRLRGITTPIAYMSSLPVDPFWIQNPQFPISQSQPPTFEYEDNRTAVVGLNYQGLPHYNIFATQRAMDLYYGMGGEATVSWFLTSAGPDRFNDFQDSTLTKPVPEASAKIEGFNRTYDPTNGTVSKGDVARTSNMQRN